MKKMRADQLAVTRGLCSSRSQAQRAILAGEVRIGEDRPVRKPGEMLNTECDLRLRAPYPYVSRGAEKLLAALNHHRPDLKGKIGLDLGASAGGFTDLLLRQGAARVYAVDVGFGQLHYKLRKDPRVVCLERVNARHLDRNLVEEEIEVLTADVSFISLRAILPAAAPLLAPEAWIFLLVKPQFEARRGEVGKGGVIKDRAVQQRCVNEITEFAENNFGWKSCGVVPSPITGTKGNQEYILTMRSPGEYGKEPF